MKAKKEPKGKKLAIFMSLFIAIIMIASTIGYMISENNSSVFKYKKLKFISIQTQNTQVWKTTYEKQDYLFSYLPQQVESINSSESINWEKIYQIYAVYDLNSSAAASIEQSIFELTDILSKRRIYVSMGLTTNSSFSLPLITCENASAFVPVIYYKIGPETKVEQIGNCIMIESDNENTFLAISDLIAYRVLGII